MPEGRFSTFPLGSRSRRSAPTYFLASISRITGCALLNISLFGVPSSPALVGVPKSPAFGEELSQVPKPVWEP